MSFNKIEKLVLVATVDREKISPLDVAKMHKLAVECKREEAVITLLDAGVQLFKAISDYCERKMPQR